MSIRPIRVRVEADEGPYPSTFTAEQAGKSIDESIEAMRETIDEGHEDAKDMIEET